MQTQSFDKYLWLKILIGMALGVALGLILSPHGINALGQGAAETLAPWIKLPGVLFLGLIQMVVIPLVLCSIILGITQSGEMDFVKKMSVRIVFYFLTTTFIAITIGTVLVNLINPGSYIAPDLVESFREQTLTQVQITEQQTFDNLTIPDRLANLLPINISKAMVEKNLLHIVIAAMIFGAALLTLPEKSAKPIKDLCVSGQDVAMKVIGWAMAIAPYAVFGLLCDITIKLGFDALIGMSIYMLTVIMGLVCMVIVYIAIASIIGRRSPVAFMRDIKETQLLAFSTSSSAATMPFTLACAEQKLGIRPEVSRFTIPLGATINMDGTALYQVIAAVFLVQIFGEVSGVDLTTTELILLMITTVGASIGTPATPGVGIVVLATILTGIGLHPAAVGFILGVDRILDMCRTTVNVTGDLTATIVMDRWLK